MINPLSTHLLLILMDCFHKEYEVMIKRLSIILLGALLLFGCASQSRIMNRLELGMTRAEVVEAMGEPKSSSAIKDIEFLKYRLRSGGGFTDEYYIRLQAGKVNAFGRVGDFGLGF